MGAVRTQYGRSVDVYSIRSFFGKSARQCLFVDIAGVTSMDMFHCRSYVYAVELRLLMR